MKRLLIKLLNKFGYVIKKIRRAETSYFDIKEKEFWEIYDLCKPYTMSSVEGMYSLYSSVKYILSPSKWLPE